MTLLIYGYNYMKRTNLIATVLLAITITSLTGCASRMIQVSPGSENVDLLNSSNVTNCKSLGKVTVSVMTNFGIYTRSADDVESNLLQLARNSAVESNADSVVKEEMPEYGRRTFSLYKCRR